MAGFGEDDLELVVKENLLTVRGKVNDGEKDKDVTYLHRGIAGRVRASLPACRPRSCERAQLANGLLDIELVREVPEAMRPQRIEIGSGTRRSPRSSRGKSKAA